ncbi:MAG TPA: rRNA maturation RNase YbeY [Clostridiales bacterium]|nr:rRNA maturation RNase YbeY [Clostridiales bacterium]
MITITGASAREKALLKKVADAALQVMRAEDAALDLSFVGRAKIRTLNATLRGVDRVTDVLSFPTVEKVTLPLKKGDYPFDVDPQSGKVYLGSIVICRARAKEQAAEYGHSVERELSYLTVHGVLHLLSFDHIEESDKTKMRAAEEKILLSLGIGRD